MILAEEKHILDGKNIVLRSAKLDEAQMLIDHLKIATGETRFLMCESDEIKYTIKEEEQFINKHNYHLYESLGFKECGRIPNANKYNDRTYDEDILMVLQF